MIRRIEKNRFMKTMRLALMWLAVYVLLVIKYAQTTFSVAESLYFSSMLFPVILGTSLFFNYHLVPKYLLKGKYKAFALYSLYLFIVSIYLETWVVVLSLMLIADYQFSSLNPEVADIVNIALVLYAVVFVHGFSVLFSYFVKQRKANEALEKDKQMVAVKSIVVTSERKKVALKEDDILYIESLSDYVKLHLADGRAIISKATISSLEAELSKDFVRIHRSFLVNKHQVSSFTKEKVIIGKAELNITRKHKAIALSALAKS